MTTVVKLDVEKREGKGKGSARALRREGKTPAIIYGGKGEEEKIAIETRALNIELNKGSFNSKLIELKVGDKTINALSRDIQFHPVTDQPEHADFLRVEKDSKINVWVKVEFKGRERCPGIKRGGILNVVRHEIEFYCTPTTIPESIMSNISELHIGDSVHIEDIELPEGVNPVISDRNFTIATIAGRAKEEEVIAAPAAEGEEGATEEGAEEGTEATAEGSDASAGEEKSE